MAVRLPYLTSPAQTLAIHLPKAALRDLVLIALEFFLTKVYHVLLSVYKQLSICC